VKRAYLVCLPIIALLTGCAGSVKRVTINESQLVGQQKPSIARCPLRLAQVLDARHSSDQSGGLGWNQVVLEDVPGMVRDELLKAGLLPADTKPAHDVVVSLKHMYMSQNHYTKNPVVVYEVSVDGGAPFVVRAQPTKANWNSSRNETVSALSFALHEANDKLMAALNARCPALDPL